MTRQKRGEICDSQKSIIRSWRVLGSSLNEAAHCFYLSGSQRTVPSGSVPVKRRTESGESDPVRSIAVYLMFTIE